MSGKKTRTDNSWRGMSRAEVCPLSHWLRQLRLVRTAEDNVLSDCLSQILARQKAVRVALWNIPTPVGQVPEKLWESAIILSTFCVA